MLQVLYIISVNNNVDDDAPSYYIFQSVKADPIMRRILIYCPVLD